MERTGLPESPKTLVAAQDENTWQHLMFAKARLADRTIPALEQSRAAVLETLAFAQSRRSHQYAVERLIRRYFGILILAESTA